MPDSDSIKAAREKVKESQAVFGRRFGVDQSTVHRWETEGIPSRGPARRAIERELAEIGTAAGLENSSDAEAAS
jgi:DNA-binding XRE family transcriptional regulator